MIRSPIYFCAAYCASSSNFRSSLRFIAFNISRLIIPVFYRSDESLQAIFFLPFRTHDEKNIIFISRFGILTCSNIQISYKFRLFSAVMNCNIQRCGYQVINLFFKDFPVTLWRILLGRN